MAAAICWVNPYLRFVFHSDTAVELHVTICFAVCAHGEFASGDASDADVFARRGPAYRAPLGLKVSLAGHKQSEFAVITEACV